MRTARAFPRILHPSIDNIRETPFFSFAKFIRAPKLCFGACLCASCETTFEEHACSEHLANAFVPFLDIPRLDISLHFLSVAMLKKLLGLRSQRRYTCSRHHCSVFHLLRRERKGNYIASRLHVVCFKKTLLFMYVLAVHAEGQKQNGNDAREPAATCDLKCKLGSIRYSLAVCGGSAQRTVGPPRFQRLGALCRPLYFLGFLLLFSPLP